MTLIHRPTKTIAVGIAMIGAALFTPAVTTPAHALQPCCVIDFVSTYYATADLTGDPVGQSDEQDCPFTPWGVVTPYYKVSKIYCTG